MKQQTDYLVAQDQHLQAFLIWVSQKSDQVPAAYKPVTVRAFYFDLAFARALALSGGSLDLARAFNSTLTCNLERHLALDLTLDRTLGLDQVIALTHDPVLVFERVLERVITHARALDPLLEQRLQKLKQQLPDDLGRDSNRFNQWWEANGEAWTEQLRATMIEYRNLGHNWQFSNQQQEMLMHYYCANSWLVDCLNSDKYTSSIVREEIEQTLLLPMIKV